MKRKLLPMMIAGLAAANAQAGTVTSSGDDVIVSTNGGFKVVTADKSKSFNIGGRIQWDYNLAELDPESGEDRIEESQFDVRRARVFLKGHVGDWAYKAQWNLDDEGSSGGDIEDLYIRYTGWGKQANVTIGRAKAPFGLEELTSSKDISILERSAITELFVPGRQDGIQLHGKGSNWTYGVGLYEAGDDDNTSGSTSGSDTTAKNIAYVGRVTVAPIQDNGNVLHLGAGYYNASGADRADTPDNVANFGLEDAFNLEVAGVNGPLHYQAEYFDGTLAFGDMIDGDDDVDGFYVQLGYILTGESRPYKDGKFKIVKPNDKSGAWEAVFRYEDGNGDFGDIELGSNDASAYTFGVNYYANNNIRIGANYTMGESDTNDDEGSEFRVRFQYVYK